MMKSEIKKVKCLVWDLDNTLWDGILSENESVALREKAVEIIKALDQRGILNSIASKNNYEEAMNKLEFLGIADFFLYPQINWNSKSDSIEEISRQLNFGIDAIAFIDDQEYELKEVQFHHPVVLCLSSEQLDDLLEMEEFKPNYKTDDSGMRRLMYQNEVKRKNTEEVFLGTKEDFLKTLNMEFTISEAVEEDLRRAEELTVRTHQLNTTGYTYSYEELKNYMVHPNYKLYIAGLTDCFGTYGKIGIALIEKQLGLWNVKLLLMSCRVMSRGVGTVFMNYIINQARKEKVRLIAEFKPNSRNKMMYVTYKFGGFKVVNEGESVNLLEYNFDNKSEYPNYIKVIEGYQP